MTRIAPFRGIKYTVPELEDVVCPPYDVISPEDRAYYHRKDPRNFVRLVLGEESPEDSGSDNRFTRARDYLEQWLAEGVMRQDTEPALYVYEQDYERGGRRRIVRGFVCLVKLARYDEGCVLPHENTLAKPKSDLIKLIRETRANLDSVYGLYPDPEHALDEILDRTAAQEPELEAKDRDGVTHRLWTASDPEDVAAVSGHLAGREVVIADGHHRYETALAYRDEMRELSPYDGDAPHDYLMMTIVNVYGPDMTIFPTHRIVRNLSAEELGRLENLGDMFEICPVRRDELLQSMAAHNKAIGMYRAGSAAMLIPKAGVQDLLFGSAALKRLDLALLHGLIMERVLGIDAERLRQQTNLTYTRDEEEAIRSVDDEGYQAAFLLNPIDVEAVLEIARAGERMPQKATYFYPKLLSGMVVRRVD